MKTHEICVNSPIKQSGFYWLGHLTYRYRRLAIVIWALLMALSLLVTPYLEDVLQETGAVYKAGRAYHAEQLLEQELNLTTNELTLVFQHSRNQEIAQDQKQIESLINRIRSLPAVRLVISPTEKPEYRSEDSHTQYSIIYLKENSSNATLGINEIETVLAQETPSGWHTFLTGASIVNRDIQKISKVDLGRIEFLVLPLTLVALLVVFGSVIAATLPIIMAIIAVSVTFGLLYLIALKLNVSIFALNLASMLGLGLGIDYSLLIVTRFRQELATNSLNQAIAHTVDTAGKAVFFSGLTVCIGLMCLMLFPIDLLQSLGMAGSLVVLLSVATALTLLPALLGIFGTRVRQHTLAVRFAYQRKEYWRTIAQYVIQHSLPAAIIVLVIIAGLTAPFLQARFGLASADILPKSFPPRLGAEILQQSFGAGEISPIFLAIQTQSSQDSVLSRHHLATLYNVVNRLKADPRVERVTSLFSLDPNLTLENYQQLFQDLAFPPSHHLIAIAKSRNKDSKSLWVFKSQTTHNGESTQQLIDQLQSQNLNELQVWITGQRTAVAVVKSRTAGNDAATRKLVQEIQSWKLDGLEVWIAGQTASELDTIAAMSQLFPIVLAIMMGVTFIVLCVLMNSIILPLKAIVMNTLSIGASFGALVFIFQDGNFHSWLNFTPVGYLDILLPVVLFCLLFGLSMDYEVFLLTRIKEAYDLNKDHTKSIVEGLERTGGIITNAALLMIIVTSAFVMARIIFVKALGLGSAIAVLIDVTLIRAVLVPATMNLLGEWNWWLPRFPPFSQHKAG